MTNFQFCMLCSLICLNGGTIANDRPLLFLGIFWGLVGLASEVCKPSRVSPHRTVQSSAKTGSFGPAEARSAVQAVKNARNNTGKSD